MFTPDTKVTLPADFILETPDPAKSRHSTALAAQNGYAHVLSWRQTVLNSAEKREAFIEDVCDHMLKNGKAARDIAIDKGALLHPVRMVVEQCLERKAGIEIQTIAHEPFHDFASLLFEAPNVDCKRGVTKDTIDSALKTDFCRAFRACQKEMYGPAL